MAASTIPNSGGPGSSIELSPVTIAVRDKVIEKFTGQPLDEMNNSLKALLSKEEDEQKRLGILAARVYILRQRILSIAEADIDRVVTSASPKPKDFASDEFANPSEVETPASEWIRLRILEDCEVNGVRFPKTVIIDVKSADAELLIDNGKAELIQESEPVTTTVETDAEPASTAPMDPSVGDKTPTDNSTSADEQPENPVEEPNMDENKTTEEAGDPSAMLEALSEEPEAAEDLAIEETLDEAAAVEQEDSSLSESVIEAPSAAEVTAALEALGAGGADNAFEPNVDEGADHDAADVAAELAALSAASDSSKSSNETSEDAAEVAAALEAASAAIAAGPSNTNTSNLPAAGEEQNEDTEADGSDKPAGWFEAQQNAEATKRDEDKSDDENA